MKFQPRRMISRLSRLTGGRRVYADWAATAPIHPEVRDAMTSARAEWGNPSSIHREGVLAREALEGFRARVARIVSVKPDDVVFTSGGTEANNMMVRGVVEYCIGEGARTREIHIVSTMIEHSSIIEPIKAVAERGVKVTFVAPGPDGVVRAEDVLAAIRPNTVLVSCMLANNEIGTIQPISRIGAGVRALRAEHERGYPIFHVDACQAPLWMSCDIEGLRADAMTLDGHKMRGPKGVGALIMRRGVTAAPLLLGGGQEGGRRSTTENVELIAGFTRALELARTNRDIRARTVSSMRNILADRVQTIFPDAHINGTLDRRLPNNLNISIPRISDPEFAVIVLDEAGVACSTRSSCLKDEEESYVAAAVEQSRAKRDKDEPRPWVSRSTIRFTLAPDVSLRDIEKIADALATLARVL